MRRLLASGRFARDGRAMLAIALSGALVPAPARSESAPPGASGQEPIVEYLYVVANEGGAAGGHSGLRIDGDVYHYHLEDPGLLRLYREDVAGFEHLYTRLRNRTLHAARIETSAESRDLLRAGFERYLGVQEAHAARIEAARDDAALLERLAEPGDDWPVQGAGLFLSDGEPAPTAGALSGSIARVRDAALGADASGVIAARLRDVARALSALQPDDPLPGASMDAIWASSLSRRHADLAALRTALLVLREGRGPRPDLLRDAGIELTPPLHAALARWRDDLLARCTAAAREGQAREGFALLVGLARLGALDVSLDAGRLLVLDAYADEHELVPREALRESGPGMKAEADAELAAALAALVAGNAAGDRAGARLESAVNRRLELDEAIAGRRDLRRNTGTLLPSRSARVGGWPRPAHEATALPASAAMHRAPAATLRARAAEDERAFRRTYAYELLSRNCVTEIFRVVDAAWIGSVSRALSPEELARSAGESRRRLGGFVDAGAGLHFIPWAAFDAVNESWRVRSTRVVRSWRHEQLDALARHGGALGESFVPSASLYERNPEDSLFLFFTDDATIARPLFGLANLMTGLGGSVAGLLAAPLDGGHLLDVSTRGLVFSLPELVGSNIRKGSYAWAPRREDGDARRAESTR